MYFPFFNMSVKLCNLFYLSTQKSYLFECVVSFPWYNFINTYWSFATLVPAFPHLLTALSYTDGGMSSRSISSWALLSLSRRNCHYLSKINEITSETIENIGTFFLKITFQTIIWKLNYKINSTYITLLMKLISVIKEIIIIIINYYNLNF